MKGKLNHLFEKTVTKNDIKYKYTKICFPKTNGKVENAHWIHDKELFQRTKFFSLRGLTPDEKFLQIKKQQNILTNNGLNDKINPPSQQEVLMKKIA